MPPELPAEFAVYVAGDLAFFHHDVPIGVALAAEYQIHVAPVRLIKLKAAVFFYKLNEAFFKHNMSS